MARGTGQLLLRGGATDSIALNSGPTSVATVKFEGLHMESSKEIILNGTLGSLIFKPGGGSYTNVTGNASGTGTPNLTSYSGNLRFFASPAAAVSIGANSSIYYVFNHSTISEYDILTVKIRDGNSGTPIIGNLIANVQHIISPMTYRIYLHNLTSSAVSFNEIQISYAIIRLSSIA